MKEIILEFKNYKLLKNEKFDLSNYMVYCFEGRNGIGKSSAITGLEELISAMAFTVQPVTGGEKEGWKKVIWEGVDGKLYTIEHTFDVKNGKGKFVAYNDKAEQITSVTKIRELLGTYSRITVDQFFEKANTAPGRRELINNFFNKILTNEERTEIQTCKAYAEKAYDERTEYGRTMKIIEPMLIELTDEQLKTVDRLPEAREKVKLRREQLNQRRELKRDFESINHDIEDLKHNILLIKEIGKTWFPDDTYQKWDKILTDTENTFIIFSKNYKEKKETDLPSEEDLTNMILRAEKIIEEGSVFHARQSQYLVNKEKYDHFKERYNEAEEIINTKRARIKEIYVNSKLPAGITIEDDGFSFHGYDFSKEQVSESEAKLAIAELMCQIDTAGLIVLGNAAIFGKERMEQICEIAKKYNKKVFLERVVDDLDEVRLVGIVDVTDIKESSKTKEPNNKKNGKKQKTEPETKPKTDPGPNK